MAPERVVLDWIWLRLPLDPHVTLNVTEVGETFCMETEPGFLNNPYLRFTRH